MQSPDWKISRQEASAAASRILKFYDTIPGDPEIFAAGLAATLLIFPRPVIARSVDPVQGIPGAVTFLNLAKIREKLDAWSSEWHIDQDRLERANRKALPEPTPDPEERKRIYEGLKKLSDHIGSGFNPSHQ